MSEQEGKTQAKAFWLVRPKEDPPFVICRTPEDVWDTIRAGEPGEEWLVKYEWLTAAEVDEAPEFDGW